MTVTILQGDCRDVLRTLPDASIHCCVTSPPYFGLRDYGTGTWKGGTLFCSHRPDDTKEFRGIASSTLGGGKEHTGHSLPVYGRSCPRCGAVRIDNQIGLEQTPNAFVLQLVEVFREVRRTLRDDGTLWLNLGDSYAAQRSGTHQPAETLAGGKSGKSADGTRVNRDRHDGYNPTRNASAIGLKHKDLIGIPWRVAFALQADGWYLRQDIIWAKPNPMPESVTDRCTKSHEYIFMFSKKPKYYFDSEAIKEDSVKGAAGSKFHTGKTGKHQLDRASAKPRKQDGQSEAKGETQIKRNKRSVWIISPKPFKEAHFATFPPALIEPCILAGCPFGGTVLDPFGGAGTTALVAEQHGRNSTLIELNSEYIQIARNRLGLSHKMPWEK